MANVWPPENDLCYLPWWQDKSYCPLCYSGIKQRLSATFTHYASRCHHEDVLLLLRNPPRNHIHAGPQSWTIALASRSLVPPSIPTEYTYVGCSSWMMTNQNTYQSDSTPCKIINHQSSLGARSFYLSYPRPCMSQKMAERLPDLV